MQKDRRFCNSVDPLTLSYHTLLYNCPSPTYCYFVTVCDTHILSAISKTSLVGVSMSDERSVELHGCIVQVDPDGSEYVSFPLRRDPHATLATLALKFGSEVHHIKSANKMISNDLELLPLSAVLKVPLTRAPAVQSVSR